jgi:hypothetical protein
MPDMLTFTPDGTRVVTANEGQPNQAYTVDPEGTISIIDLGEGARLDIVKLRQSDVTTLSCHANYPFLAVNLDFSKVQLRADELIATMESAVSRVPSLDGRFPQIAGMFLEYDPNQPALEAQASVTTPSRVRTLIVYRADGKVVIATNSFLLTGGDGYLSLKSANDDPARTVFTTDIGEQQILIDYVGEVLDGEV